VPKRPERVRLPKPGRTPRRWSEAGIPHFHPHDFRHRYASVKLREGVPVTDLAAQLGHSKKSLTLDTYSHVLLDDASAQT
jgi:integrase